MKKSTWLLLGGAAALGIGYFWWQSQQQSSGSSGGGSNPLSGIIGAVQKAIQGTQGAAQQAASQVNGFNALNQSIGALGTLSGDVYAATNPGVPLGSAGINQNEALSTDFNVIAAGGVEATEPQADSITLNPGLSPTGVGVYQNAITNAAIAAGIGVGSKINWGSNGSASPGGVITNWNGLEPSNTSQTSPVITSAPSALAAPMGGSAIIAGLNNGSLTISA